MQEIRARGRGKTFVRSVDAARRRVKDGETYLIRRNGAWFRPGAQGYSLSLAGAGVYDGATARGYLDVEGLSVVPLKSLQPDIKIEAERIAAEMIRLEAQTNALHALAVR